MHADGDKTKHVLFIHRRNLILFKPPAIYGITSILKMEIDYLVVVLNNETISNNKSMKNNGGSNPKSSAGYTLR